jgi:hypothetical protein
MSGPVALVILALLLAAPRHAGAELRRVRFQIAGMT